MTSELEIQDANGGLFIRVTRKGTALHAAFSGAVAVAGIAIMGRYFMRPSLLIPLAVLVALADVFYVLRTKTAELRVSNVELTSRARIEGLYRSSRSVPCAEIRWLEYQEDTTGPETAHHPGGLYAVLKHSNVCVLPFVDEHQAAVVIDRILEKFPDFRNQWEGQSPFGQHFTTLDLDRPTRPQKA